jgi:tetratricopeptide (TPR) repeat protein
MSKHFKLSSIIRNISMSMLGMFLVSSFLAVYGQNVGADIAANPADRSLYFDAAKQKVLENYDKALELFQRYQKQNPDDPAAYYEMADIYSALKDFDQAIEMAEKAVELDTENKWYKILLFQLYQSRSNYDKAGEVISYLLEKDPDNIEYIQELALNYIYNGELKEAIRIYDSLQDKIGITEEVSQQKHRIYLLLGKEDKAIQEIEELSNAFPDETRYLEMLAELYLSEGKNDLALETYKRILEIDPDNPYINISLSDYYRQIGEKEKSLEYLKSGFANPNLDIDTKVQILLSYYTVNEIFNDRKEEAFKLAGLMIQAHPQEPKAWSIYADLLYQDKKLEEARDAFEKVIMLDSSKYLVWEQLLFVESELSDFNAMADKGERAIKLFPQQPLLYLFAGVGRFQKKDYEEAVEHFENGVKFTVSNNKLLEQFFSYLGDTYFQLKNHTSSDQAYEKALKINPDNSIVLNNYAYYLSLRKEKLDRAEEMSRKAVELDPNSSNQDTYGWVLFQKGNYAEAKVWIGKSLEQEGESAVVVEHYGDVLWKLGDKKNAVKYWEKAIKLGEGSELLEKKVEEKQYFE